MREEIITALTNNATLMPKLKQLYRGKGDSPKEYIDSISDRQIQGMYNLLKMDGNV